MDNLIFAAALGALVPSFVLLHLYDKALARALPPQCNHVLDAKFLLSAEAIYPHLECMGFEGCAMYLDFYLFDLVLFPVIYSTCLAGAIARAWAPRTALRALPILAAVVDVVENVLVCLLLSKFPWRYPGVEAAVSVLTRTKWALVCASGVALAAGVARRTAGFLPSGRAKHKGSKDE